MSPTAFVDAVSAWALAPGFTRVPDGRWTSAAADTTRGEDGRRHRSSEVGAGRDDARGPARIAVTGPRPSDHRIGAGLPAARRHVTDESEAA
jgi:hypothetical protein